MKARWVTGAFVMGAVAVLFFLHDAMMRRALLQQERFLVRQWTASFRPLFAHARERRDDLAVETLLRALSKSPGISHVRLSEARDNALTLSVSPHLRRKLVARQRIESLLALLAVAIAFGVYISRQSARLHVLRERVGLVEALLESEKRASALACQKTDDALKRVKDVLRLLMPFMEKPHLVMDSRQRILAMSPSAEQWMSEASLQGAISKSWHDVPFLSPHGAAIDAAVAQAERPVRVALPELNASLLVQSTVEGLLHVWIEV